MTDVLPASETTDLPLLPQGWHVVTHAVLADGALGILGSEFDVRALLAAWRDPERSTEPANPFKDGAGVPARIWTFDGTRLTAGPAFRLYTLYPKFDRFPDGRWLLAATRSLEEPISRVFDADGGEVRRIQLGDGIKHVQIDDAGHIWIGWSDEGVFGNQGFFGDAMTWSYPGLLEPPSYSGLAAFDEHGRLLALAPSEAQIADCYALNVAGRTAWACTYTDFPVLSITVGEAPRLWRTGLIGPKAIVIRPPFVLAAGGYELGAAGLGVGSDRLALVRLGDERGETVGEWRLPFKTHDWRDVELLNGRGGTLHAVRGGAWHRWRIGDALGA